MTNCIKALMEKRSVQNNSKQNKTYDPHWPTVKLSPLPEHGAPLKHCSLASSRRGAQRMSEPVRCLSQVHDEARAAKELPIQFLRVWDSDLPRSADKVFKTP